MRMMLKAIIPTEDGNRTVKDGTLAQILRKTIDTLQAEAAYFTTTNGQRTMIAVFDMKAASDMPRIAEPLFTGVNASVDFTPCMNVDDLKAGPAAAG